MRTAMPGVAELLRTPGSRRLAGSDGLSELARGLSTVAVAVIDYTVAT